MRRRHPIGACDRSNRGFSLPSVVIRRRRIFATIGLLTLAFVVAAATPATGPRLAVGALTADLVIDGRLDEPAWASAAPIDDLTAGRSAEGAAPSRTDAVRVLAGPKAIVIGIVCDDPDPSASSASACAATPRSTSEDHVRIVLGPFLDGRSGYVFAVNPSGARYDGLINPGGESDNPDWDGIWEAATARTRTGLERRDPDSRSRR